ncbi:MAG TPA: phage baseplate assembly protein V [Thiobacillaceae bacterium]|nr:phage baseplate assembly protein V [Thiobacillaceae bacterium]HNA82033.1 phage baseplate assembly protein V [Thiobacillaceae bacterium]HNF87963.1 phage baseplate assembly protein V [Thiobacillaceae bacterium]HNH89999.1 phage baseplate assembly protein V [Thiobacillaceae bacterium]HNI08681.1 phage baseplate assembly protein V [Thiobacillaceae bacterium]
MSSENDELLYRLAEQQRSRHYGKYRGVVTDVDDPDKLGRLKARVDAVYGDADSPWALPALAFAGPGHGLALLPEVGDGVWIEFVGGDLSYPVWTGCWWGSGQRPAPDGNKARLLATSAGHQVLIDEDANEMKLIHPGGAEIVMDSEGITLKMGSCELKISSTEINLNNGMVKVTTAGASLVNDAFKVGA